MADGIPDGVETRAAVKSGKNSFGSDKDYKKVNQFSCMSCQKLFWSKTSLNRHVKEFHENVKPYTCQICHKSFGRKDYLKKHIQISHDKAKPYACQLCHVTFEQREILQAHLKMAHNFCSQSPELKANLAEHVDKVCETVKPKPLEEELDLKTPIKTGHDTTAKTVTCRECNKSFKQNKYLNRHVKNIHNKHLTSLNCKQSLGPNANMKRNVHGSAERVYCRICNKSFKQLVNLSRHFRASHENLKNFEEIIYGSGPTNANNSMAPSEQGSSGQQISLPTSTVPVVSEQGPPIPSQSNPFDAVPTLEAPSPTTQCRICKIAIRISEFDEHMQSQHSIQEIFLCTKCNSNFLFRAELFDHAETFHQESVSEMEARYPDIQDSKVAIIKFIQDNQTDSPLSNEFVHQRIKNIKHQAESVNNEDDLSSGRLDKDEQQKQVNTSIEQRVLGVGEEVLELCDTNEDEVIACSTCGLTFESYKLLSKHQEIHFQSVQKERVKREIILSSDDEDFLECPYCFVKLESQSVWSKHVYKHAESKRLEAMKVRERKRRIEEERERKKSAKEERERKLRAVEERKRMIKKEKNYLYNCGKTEDQVIRCPDSSCLLKFDSADVFLRHVQTEHKEPCRKF